MNSALRKQVLAERRRDRRLDIMASVIGWTVTAIGGAIGAGVFYAFAFIVLAMEPIQ